MSNPPLISFALILFGVFFLLPGCSVIHYPARLDYQQSAPWFKGEALNEIPVVLLPVFKSGMEEEIEGLDNLLASVARKNLEARVFDAPTARKILEKNSLDQGFNAFLNDFVSVEVLDKKEFRKFTSKWEEELASPFSLLAEIKDLVRFRDTSANESTDEVDGEKQIKETTTFTSGVRVTLRLSVIRHSDGALAWVGENTNRVTKQNSQSRIVEGPGKTSAGNAVLENMVGSALFGGGDPYAPSHPAYPSYESAIEKNFIILLKALKRTKIPSP